MQGEVRRKTLLESILETLPAPLKEAYDAAPRKNSTAHEILRLLVAKYLWENGYRKISFETSVNCCHGENIYVDVHEKTLGLFIECERNPDRKAINDRRKTITNVYPTAKFVLATQDRMGWKALKLAGLADEVWVVCRDGRVFTPTEWVEERCKTLKAIFNPAELGDYISVYEEAEEEYRKFKRLADEEEAFWRQILDQTCLRTAEFRMEWLKNLRIRGAWSRYAEAAEKRMEEAKNKIIAKVVELLNAVLSLSSPYTLKLCNDYVIEVGVDWDAWQWLGWKDHPSKSPAASAQYRILEKNLQRELKIATGNIKPEKHKQVDSKAEIKWIIEYKHTFKELRKDIEEIKKMIPLLAQRLQPPQPNTEQNIAL
ncbi:MAG: hypothetical protein QXZ68_07760 [Candidatus Bathyarchaeia archaeon]